MRSIALLLVLLVWILLGWKMCSDYTECCSGDNGLIESGIQGTTQSGASGSDALNIANCQDVVCFALNSSSVVLGSGFERFRDSLLASLNDKSLIRITGLYDVNETNDTDESNLGLGRAKEVAKLFRTLDDGRIVAAGQQTVGQAGGAGDRIRFYVLDGGDSNTSTSPSETDSDERIAESTSIYFPSNSVNRIQDAAVEKYLRDVVQRVKESGENIRLTGHTDSQGSDDSNLALGRRRAIVIKNFIIDRGVASSRVEIRSRGESEPVASNNSESGRAKNRRVELQILK